MQDVLELLRIGLYLRGLRDQTHEMLTSNFLTLFQHISAITYHLSEGLFVRNGVVQIPKFDDKPNSAPL